MIAQQPGPPALRVFAQQARPALEVAALVQQAARFFGTTLAVEGLDATGLAPAIAAARVTANGAARTCFGRPATAEDLADAQAAESRAGYTGMSLLAARCGTVWVLPTETDDDETALLVAAILASVLLGPILSADGSELFGVKTARTKLGR